MEKILIIEKTKGMEKRGAINLLKYHRGLQQIKASRLAGQLKETNEIDTLIEEEIERREKEEEL